MFLIYRWIQPMRSESNTAEGVSERHAHTINERDVEAYRQTMNFPFT